MRTEHAIRQSIRYSEAFKIQVVRELEAGGITLGRCRRKYGVGGAFTLQRWVFRYGNGGLNVGKVIRVEKPGEINELARLRSELRRVKEALADAHIDLALERAYTELACERAGMDPEEFKKKAAGKLRIKR